METKTITLELDETTYALLEVLTKGEFAFCESVEEVIYQLIDHAQQGIYRPGAWERQWLSQAFSDEFLNQLEIGDPHAHQRKQTPAKWITKESVQRPSEADREAWLASFDLCPFDRPKREAPKTEAPKQ